MKKIVVWLTVTAMCFVSLTACQGNKSVSVATEASTTAEVVTTTAAETTAAETTAAETTAAPAPEQTEEQLYSQDLNLTNGTGVAIFEIYISTSDDDNWGEDLLGEEVFMEDETLRFTTDLMRDDDTTWDIKVVDEDDDELIFKDVDFSSTREIVLHWGDDGKTPSVTLK